MKENKIFTSISLFTLICLNPLFYWFGFKSSPLINSKFFILSYLIFFSLLISVYFLQKRGGISSKLNNYIFLVEILIVFYCLIFLINKVLNVGNKDTMIVNKNESYLFPPRSNAYYHTSEFQYNAKINSFGLRDREFTINKSSKTRILFVGDSFTFGWGVENEFSLPKQLETILNKESKNEEYEVINCGKGGSGVSDYLKAINLYSEIYKPDYVFIGFLQFDDLAQEYEKWFEDSLSLLNLKSTIENNPSKIKMLINDFKETSIGNFVRKFSQIKNKEIEVKNNYKTLAKSMFESFNNYQKMKFSMLDENLKKMFLNGDLNPSLINIYVNFAERSFVFNDPTKYVTLKAIQLSKEKFNEIKKISDKSNFKVYVFNFPVNLTTGHKVIRSHIENYFSKFITSNNHIDSIYRDISNSVNFFNYDFTNEFKTFKNKNVLYFKYDGHMTPIGNSFLANCIFNKIKNEFK